MRFSVMALNVCTTAGERRWDLPGYIAQCQAAERVGFYAAYNGERIGWGDASGRHGGSHDAAMMCAYGLAHTARLRVSSGVVLLPLRHPITVVQTAAMLNALYPGRHRLTVGAGYTRDDFDAVGVPRSERGARMEAGLEAIRAYRRREPVALEAPWSGRVGPSEPAVDPSAVEVFAGGWSETGVRRAARLADGWVTGSIQTIETVERLACVYRDECERHGRRPRIVLMREAAIADTDREARERFVPSMVEHQRVYIARGNAYDPRYDRWLAGLESPDDLTFEHIGPDRFLCGSATTWVEALTDWHRRIGFEEIVLRLRYVHGPGLDAELESIDRIADDVMPRVTRPP